MTLTTLLSEVFVIHGLGFDAFYMSAKFDDSSLSRSRDIIGDPKI